LKAQAAALSRLGLRVGFVTIFLIRTWAQTAPLEFTGHVDKVNSVTFSPDGNRLLTASADGTARLWDSQTGASLKVLRWHTASVNQAIFWPSRDRMLTGSSDENVGVWNGSGEFLTNLNYGIGVFSLALSPDGKRLLVGTGTPWPPPRAGVYVYDGEKGGSPLLRLGDDLWVSFWAESFYGSVGYSPIEAKILTGNFSWWNGRSILWDVTTPTPKVLFFLDKESVSSVAFSPDGKRALTAGGASARLWDVSTGKEIRAFSGHSGTVNSVGFSPEGKTVLTGSSDKTARLWDVTTGQALLPVFEHPDAVTCAAFSPDGRTIVTGSADGKARQLSLEPLKMETGALVIYVSPAEAVTAGAQWRRVGTARWFNSGETESNVPAGTHTIEFEEVAGWTVPASLVVTITAGQTTSASVAYVPEQKRRSRRILVYVLSDQQEDNKGSDWYRDPSDLSTIVSVLGGLGFEVDVRDRKANPQLPTGEPHQYSQIWISECDADAVVDTTAAEVKALRDYFLAGGSVWLGLEGTLFGGSEDWKEDVAAYAEAFGCEWRGNHFDSSPRRVTDRTHPILEGLDWIKFNGGGCPADS
jgi:hypothetical protein